MGTQILNLRPADAFSLIAGPGNVFSGGAVAFQPAQDCSLVSVSLLLRGFSGANGQQIILQLCDNNSVGNLNQPGLVLTDAFTSATSNDGSIAEFVFNLPGGTLLTGGKIYWLVAYGGLNPASMKNGAVFYWVSGSNPVGTPAGNSIYIGALNFANANYSPTTAIPAFSINVTP